MPMLTQGSRASGMIDKRDVDQPPAVMEITHGQGIKQGTVL